MRRTWRACCWAGPNRSSVRAREGVELINQALAGFAKAGARVAITYFLTLLAEAQAQAGDSNLVLRTVEDAL